MTGYNSTSGTNSDRHAAETTTNTNTNDERPDHASQQEAAPDRPREFGGRKKGLEPTRYGDWEKDGRCIDF